MKSFLFVVGIGLLAAHCSSTSTQVVNSRALQTAASAESLARSGNMAEAAALIYDLQYLHPDDPAVRRLKEKLSMEYRTQLESDKLLGKNVLHKKRRSRTTGEKIVYYLPDLVGDFLDIFTVELSIGPQIGIDLHATRAVSATAYTGATLSAGVLQKQGVAWRRESSLEINAGPVGPNAVSGTVESILHSDRPDTGSEKFVLHNPKGNLYQTYRDYWSGGYKLGLVLIGGTAEIHLLEIADFLTGIVGYDLLDDNIGATAKFDMTAEQADTKNYLENYISSGELSSYQNDFPKLEYISAEEKAAWAVEQLELIRAEEKGKAAKAKADKKFAAEQANAKALGLIQISASSDATQPAQVVILNFKDGTGSNDYGYISTSVSSAVYDSMKKRFVFRGGNPDANDKLAENLSSKDLAETPIYAELCEKADADYLVGGSYTKLDAKQIEVVAHVYSRREKKVILSFKEKRNVSSDLFGISDKISKDVVKLMKSQPRT